MDAKAGRTLRAGGAWAESAMCRCLVPIPSNLGGLNEVVELTRPLGVHFWQTTGGGGSDNCRLVPTRRAFPLTAGRFRPFTKSRPGPSHGPGDHGPLAGQAGIFQWPCIGDTSNCVFVKQMLRGAVINDVNYSGVDHDRSAFDTIL